MECPSCHETLRPSYRKGVEIDFCPNCRGVWLDRGELEQLVEATIASDAALAKSSGKLTFKSVTGAERSIGGSVDLANTEGRTRRRGSWLDRLLDFGS
jgi:hypothetical protein